MVMSSKILFSLANSQIPKFFYEHKANIHVGKAVINKLKMNFLLTKCRISQLGMHTILQWETMLKNILVTIYFLYFQMCLVGNV